MPIVELAEWCEASVAYWNRINDPGDGGGG